jgi:hypothetical protein
VLLALVAAAFAITGGPARAASDYASARPTAQTTPPLISPFPRVVISGHSSTIGTRVSRLTVRGPEGARVDVRCQGRGCPFPTRALPIRYGQVAFGEFPDMLSPNAVIEVAVTSPGTIGQHVRFRIRRRRAPRRRDRCLLNGYPQPILCPQP